MVTNRPKWDYEKVPVIVSQVVKLCSNCGANMCHKYFDYCPKCGCLEYSQVFEHMAGTFRRGLREKQEEAELHKAREIARDALPQMDVFLELVGEVLNMDAETEAMLNSWIEENERVERDEWEADTRATRESDRP